jgi:hypothetical protein
VKAPKSILVKILGNVALFEETGVSGSMGVVHSILVGYANGDVRSRPVRSFRRVGREAARAAACLGKLTKSGFCTVVAAAWHGNDDDIAGLLYAADWNGNRVEVLVKHGDHVAPSAQLYSRWKEAADRPLTSTELVTFCRRLKPE